MDPFEAVTEREYLAYRHPRFGKSNGERLDNPLWQAAIRCQWDAHAIGDRFNDKAEKGAPRWCFQRVGMSCTLLRQPQSPTQLLWIGGEHEDFYDDDFNIYNDIILTELNGDIRVYGYPRSVFPPTDFHSSTLVTSDEVAASVLIIGRLGYREEYILGTTPIFELRLEDMRITEVEVFGSEPSWLHRHQALYLPPMHSVAVFGGYTIGLDGKRQRNTQSWQYRIRDHEWSPIETLAFEQLL